MHVHNAFAAADAGARAETLARAVREVVRRLDDERTRTVIVQPNGDHGVCVLVHAPDGVSSIVTRPDQRGLLEIVARADVGSPGDPWLHITTARGVEGSIDLHLAREIADENMRALTAARDQADFIRELLLALGEQKNLRVSTAPLARVA